MNKIKEKALNLIVEEAADMFLEKSITTVTMEEIAKSAGIGAASMYRYFGTKQALAVKAATLMAQNIYKTYYSEIKGENGYERIKAFYMSYLAIYRDKPGYFRFIREFDSLFLADAGEEKHDYENEIDRFLEEFLSFYDQGIKDGSIREVGSPEVFYYSTAHSLMSLCKSLVKGKELISQDSLTKQEDEIMQLIEIILYRLGNNQ